MSRPALDLSAPTTVIADLARWTLLADDGTPTGESWWDRCTEVEVVESLRAPFLLPPRHYSYERPSPTLTPLETERTTFDRLVKHLSTEPYGTIHPVAVELWAARERFGAYGWWKVTMPRLHAEDWPKYTVRPNPQWPVGDTRRFVNFWIEEVDTIPPDAPIPWIGERDRLFAEHGVTW